MCGKFTQMLSWRRIVELGALQQTIGGEADTVTPMRLAAVIACDFDGKRRTVPMRWGLPAPDIDSRAAKPHIHARAETIDVKPAFRAAFAARRGILAVASFNEGHKVTPRRTEQYVLTPDDGAPIGIAVIWQPCQAADGTPCFAMVTVPPNALIATITDRMPALIAPADWPLWLGEIPAPPAAAKALLAPSPRTLTMTAAAEPRAGQPRLF